MVRVTLPEARMVRFMGLWAALRALSDGDTCQGQSP